VTTNPFAGGTPVDEAHLTATRFGLHQVVEHVLAAELHRHTGRIGLRPTPGGVGTPTFIVDGTTRQLRVDGADLVLVQGDERRAAPLTTLAEAAAALDVVPAPPEVYTAVTPFEPDRPLDLDPAVVRALSDWLRVGSEALERFSAAHGGLESTAAQLWPEHFDLAISMAEVNYGVSPGDAVHPLPYAYVGPWAVPADAGADGSWWNESYGRGVSAVDLHDAQDLVALFEEGWSRTS
jgi:hypothetical protein